MDHLEDENSLAHRGRPRGRRLSQGFRRSIEQRGFNGQLAVDSPVCSNGSSSDALLIRCTVLTGADDNVLTLGV